MATIHPIHEGSISAKPLGHHNSGTIRGTPEGERSGRIHGTPCSRSGSLRGDPADSPENSAIAELGGLISSIGSLSTQAQSLPLTPPSLPGLPQNAGYQRQMTDYSQFSDESN
ncbi:MAG: hypothetical protein WA814_13730 [Candidatus Baltobacteraceae bacterium]